MRVFYGWYLVILVLFLMAVGMGIISYGYAVLMAPVGIEFEASRFQLMQGMMFQVLISSTLGPLVGPLVDRLPMRWLVGVGVVMLAAGLWVLSLATALWHAIAAFSLFFSMVLLLLGPLTLLTLVARWFSAKRGLALGVAALGTSTGGFFFPPLIQWLIDSYGWRDACQLLATGVMLLCLPLVLWLMVDRPKAMGLEPDGGTVPVAAAVSTAQSVGGADFGTARGILGSRVFWLLAFVIAALYSVFSVLLSNLALFARDQGVDSSTAAMLLSLLALAGMTGKILFGFLADRTAPWLALLGSALLLLGGVGCFLAAGGLLFLMAGSGLCGLATGAIVPATGMTVARAFGSDNYGRVMGLLQPLTTLPAIVMPPLAGFLFDRSGSYQAVFSLLGLFLLLAIAATPMMRQRSAGLQPAL